MKKILVLSLLIISSNTFSFQADKCLGSAVGQAKKYITKKLNLIPLSSRAVFFSAERIDDHELLVIIADRKSMKRSSSVPKSAFPVAIRFYEGEGCSLESIALAN